ncbi:MAG TPA: glycosyl hydrolase [Ohtaekwangia sp.]
MLRFFIAMIIAVIVTPADAQPKSAKRGVAYGQNSAADLEVLSSGVSWWYNWHHQPENAVLNSYESYDFDYVPMGWNGSFDKAAMRAFLLTHPNVKYLLGWNEPNFTTQANMTPTQAAAHWPDLEELADEFDLELVSPAMNYCDQCVSENGTTYSDPVKYLDDFFAACTGCRVDHIAIHSYMGNVSALQWYVGLFKKYDKPIWVTEFANWENNPTLQVQKSFMVGAVDYLENDPDVFRYAWFTGRFSGAPYIGILKYNQQGALTDLGDIYVNMPLHDPEHYEIIPATIEAEKYNRMQGILLELTSDEDGLANVGYIEAGDWLEYGIDVPETKEYYFSTRVAATQNASFQVIINGVTVQTIQVPNTNGWQNWSTVTIPLTLPAGEQKITIKANTSGFNLNWFNITDEIIISNEEVQRESIHIFPNPATDKISIQSPSKIQLVEITDLLGQTVYSLVPDENTIDVSHLGSGAYILRLTSVAGNTFTEKIFRK